MDRITVKVVEYRYGKSNGMSTEVSKNKFYDKSFTTIFKDGD